MTNIHHQHAVAFRQRFCNRETLLGTFIKSSGGAPVEIMGQAGFDFVVVDAEHAPFDRAAVELSILAARASGIASIVRVPSASPHALLAPLDDGACGVMVPHVRSAQVARDIVAACRYAWGRGFSNSPRAGGYGVRTMWEHVDAADQAVTVIAMIEDPEALDEIDDILAVDGIDGVFIGRGDLAVALQDREPGSPQVAQLTDRVLQACARADKPACLLTTRSSEAQTLQAFGASAFVIASDQGFMRTAAEQAQSQFRAALSSFTTT
ncbi:HpcH/HpaI aldolase family protein [Ottowia thiooxydans]|uniref:HpcH/HpaI aldolase family protein n=1 Tax=Ottowia thiooxydans TaxID=219182 RepID=UPI000568483D|nr:aldolase/citrate lyase family protein [Ottowia thiooxydans]